MRRRDYVMLSTKLGEARKVTQQQAGAECDEMRGYDWAIADWPKCCSQTMLRLI